MTWEEQRELKHLRLKEIFPNQRDRWVFDDIYCNRGRNRTLGVPTALRDLQKWIESNYIHEFSMDALIDAMFYKISNAEVSPNNMEKLDRFLKPFFKKHRKFLKEHPEWKEENPFELSSDSDSSRKWRRNPEDNEPYFDKLQMR